MCGPHPFAFSAKGRNEDTPTYREAMEGPDREGFLIAMDKEIESLTTYLDAWNVVATSKGKWIFDVTWSFLKGNVILMGQ